MDGWGIQNVSRKILSLIGQDLFQFQGRIQKVVFLAPGMRREAEEEGTECRGAT